MTTIYDVLGPVGSWPIMVGISNNTEHMEKMYKENDMSFGDAKNMKNWLVNSFGTFVRDYRGRPLAIGKKAVHVSRAGSHIDMNTVTIVGFNQDKNTVQVRHTGSKRISNVKIPTRLIVL